MKNPHDVTVEDFFGLVYHEGLKYSLTAMWLSTGLVNNDGYPIVLAMKILNLANLVDLDYKISIRIGFLQRYRIDYCSKIYLHLGRDFVL